MGFSAGEFRLYITNLLIFLSYRLYIWYIFYFYHISKFLHYQLKVIRKHSKKKKKTHTNKKPINHKPPQVCILAIPITFCSCSHHGGSKYTRDPDKVLKNDYAIQAYRQYIIKNVNIGSVPKGNFLFKVRYKCRLAVVEHSVYMEAADSEIVILLLWQKHAFSRSPSPVTYIIVKEDGLNRNPKECSYFYILN